ncbi:MAG: hypothetical protein LBB47_06880, partial [Spirochaetaceae bacterium]|nr:hypothetical protein [Spirochaetaceae bacterium]
MSGSPRLSGRRRVMTARSLEEAVITGRLSAIRKLLFRIKTGKISLPHIINSVLVIAADRVYYKLKKCDYKFETDIFIKRWLKNIDGKKYFDFNGAFFPDIRNDDKNWDIFFPHIFEDTFLIDCYYDDNYGKNIVDVLDKLMGEGPYGYTDESAGFDVRVKSGDVVIDAGAWFGDFSAYAASKGALTYAFEPV